MATIKYFVPEDGDTEEHPNIFMLPRSTQSGSSPRLGDVMANFPMPGRYHFRFKSPLIPGTDREKGAVAVWMDCVDENQNVGVWKNSIFAKVTRISMDDANDDEEDYDDEHEYEKYNQTVPGHADQHRRSLNQEPIVKPPAPEVDKVLDIFDDPTPTPTQGINTLPETIHGSMNLLDHPSLTAVTSNGNGEGSLLNLDSTTYSKNDSASDFLGMTATAAPVPRAKADPTPTLVQPNPQTYMAQPHRQPHIQNNNGNTFQSYPPQNGPFGGLEWK